jgi:hypothetical protein
MKKFKLIVLSIIVLSITEVLIALPRFSLKYGNKCFDCHYNPTGGEMRKLDGWNWGKNT